MDHSVDCCIAGGGPAGMMLGVLLARKGVRVCVLEKHADFLRDFRGDTIHPSTMQVLSELGWLDEFLRLPHQPVAQISAHFGDREYVFADMSHLPVEAPYIAMMPQWDFLNFLARKGAGFANFDLRMSTRAVDVIRDGARITGVAGEGPEGRATIAAKLVVAADGRTSTLREKAGFEIEEIGAPMDVLWFRLPREPADTQQTQGRFMAGRIFIMLNRGDYWQCAFVIAKGGNDAIRRAGLDAFRDSVAPLLPFARNRVDALRSLDDVKLLNVQIDRLKTWAKPGLLCIGDAAHAMSPIGGVGVNLAVQDAVATANILAETLRDGVPDNDQLAQVQRRRQWPTVMTQRLQVMMQNAIIAPTLKATAGVGEVRPPLFLRLADRLPLLRRIPARVVGLGLRPEHIEN